MTLMVGEYDTDDVYSRTRPKKAQETIFLQSTGCLSKLENLARY
jgi:hypothetical protein